MSRVLLITWSLAAALGCSGAPPPDAQPAPADRLAKIRTRGHLNCGVEPGVPGFSDVDAAGGHHGFDIDICRALAAAIFGAPDRIKFLPAPSIAQFLGNDDIDVAARRLSWEVRREGVTGLLFGPITFFDGQAVIVPKSAGIRDARDLAGTPICVAGGAPFEINLTEYFASNRIALRKTVLESPHDYAGIARQLSRGECRAYSGDLSDLGAIRARISEPDAFTILPDRLSEEPLAPVVRGDDPRFFTILRWTVLALIAAEELGVTSGNVDQLLESSNLAIRRLLGVMPGNGAALGLDERWAYQAIKSVGNYGEVFDRNVGRDSPIRLDRGPNRLRRDGGLMFAPPLR